MRLFPSISNSHILFAGLTFLHIGCSRVHIPTKSSNVAPPTTAVAPSTPAHPIHPTITHTPSLPPQSDLTPLHNGNVEPPLPNDEVSPSFPSVFSEATAVRYAVQHSPASFRSSATLETTRGEAAEMRAEMLPTLTLESEAGRADRLSSNRQDDPADAGIGLFLRQRIFDGKAGWFRYLSAKHRTEAAYYEREAAQNRVAAEIRIGFARMRHWYRLSKAQNEELTATNALVKRLSLLTAYGLTTSESLARLQAQGSNLQAAEKESLTKLQHERRAILELIGAPATTKLNLGPATITSTHDSASALAIEALQHRPELKAAAFAVQAQRAALESVKRERYPSAELIVGLATEGQLDQSIRSSWQTDGRVGVRAEWSAFDSGRNKAKQQQEYASLREAEAEYAQLKRSIQLDILNAIESIEIASNQVRSIPSKGRVYVHCA